MAEGSGPTGNAAAPSAPRRPGSRLPGWALATAIAALAVSLTSPLWGPAVVGDAVSPRIAAVERGLDRLGKAVVERTDPVAARLSGLQQEFRDQGRTSDQRMDELRRLALIGAVAQLRTALARPTPYPLELAAVAGLTAGRAELTAAVALLAPHATTGIATLRQVRARFDEHAVRALMAEASSDDVPMVSQLVTWISATAPLGSGRFVLDLTMPTTAAAVRTAGQRLDTEDLEGALAALARLEGTAAAAMAPWMEQARARAVAARVVDQLTAAAVAGTVR